MDTKWRSKKRLLLYAFLLVIGLSGPFTLWKQGSQYLHRDYFQTQEFRQQLDHFAAHLNLFELNSLTQQEAKSSIKVEPYEIDNYRNRQGNLTDQLTLIQNEYDVLIENANANRNDAAAKHYTAQRDSKVKDLIALFEDDKSVIALIRKEKEQRIERYYRLREIYRSDYNDLKDKFDYYLQNTSTGPRHSSLAVQDEQAARTELYDTGFYLYATNYTIDAENYLHNTIEGHELLDSSSTPFQGWIAVSKDSPLKQTAEKYRREQIILFAYALLSSVLLIITLTRFKNILSTQTGTSTWTDGYRTLPLDVKLAAIGGTAALTVILLENLARYYPLLYDSPMLYGGRLLVSMALAAFGMAITLIQGQFFAIDLRRWSDVKKAWSHSLVNRGGLFMRSDFVRAKNQVKDSFIYKSSGIRLFAFAAVYIVIGFLGAWAAVSYYYNRGFFYPLFALIIATVGIFIHLQSVRYFGYLNRVAKAAEELASGRMPDSLPKLGSGVLTSLADNLNALRQGVRILQNEQAKSERLKTELITNVSHDLRTPLTSIITYAELLKSEGATTEERAAYVEIIDQKSKRLKTMIDDLFEVSAMSSGNAKLLLEQTDLVQLMQQALAEYKDSIDSSDIQFRVSLPEGPIYSPADGQKLWRVFDNLIGNMLKYSLTGTRAYISMQLLEQHKVSITFKNISKYEINDNADELFERFKRGDVSRHTEGSGLGLAIAKSIIDLHDGRLELETDGDLFKASVVLKVAEGINL